MKIKEALYNAKETLKKYSIEEPMLKARLLLVYLLEVKKEYLIIHGEEEIEDEIVILYDNMIEEIVSKKPIQYITNHQEFMKLDFYVDENVLIPRADTENLVEEVIEYCNKHAKESYKILDLCTGSGAIGISLAKYIENCSVVCVDISEKALEVAKKNAEANKVRNVKFLKSNMFENIEERFDIIVSNPPYIRKDVITSLDKEVQNEPIIALDGGNDGLDFYRIIVREADKYLNENGGLFLEIGYDQKDDVIKLLKENSKYKQVYSKKDLCGNDRIVVGLL